ncbi:unnamed protein product [Citrullus colocynthis]|uniref:Inhibitor I9 domain-containing protein n=1 Tax=Citrullus colocynthis TaxID=252529 RepID=A0ABP0Y822_9ROSI
MGAHSHGGRKPANIVTDSHHEFLRPFLESEEEFTEDAIFYSYTRHINGFAAMLEDEVAAQLATLGRDKI